MFSICALGFAPAVRLPISLDTAVAHVAISASGIVAGGAGAGGAGGFADSVVFCSAAPTKIGGSEQATSPAISEEQRNDRRDPRDLFRGLSLASLMVDSLHVSVRVWSHREQELDLETQLPVRTELRFRHVAVGGKLKR